MDAAFATDRGLTGWSALVVLVGLGVQIAGLIVVSRAWDRRTRIGLLGGVVLVLAGLGGVVHFGMRAEDTATARWREAVGRGAELTARLNADTERARIDAEAAAARERTAALELQTAQANRDAEQARLEQKQQDAQVADLQMRLADAERETAEAKRDAEASRVDYESLKTKLTWREILPAGREQMASVLAGGGGNVTIFWVDNDPETLNLAIQVSEIFREANKIAGSRKWNVRGLPRSYGLTLLRGMFVPGPVNPAVETIRKACETIGLVYAPDDAPGTPSAAEGEAEIVLGTKPQPF